MSAIDYSTPVLLQYGEDDESSEDEGMLCKLDLDCFCELSSDMVVIPNLTVFDTSCRSS